MKLFRLYNLFFLHLENKKKIHKAIFLDGINERCGSYVYANYLNNSSDKEIDFTIYFEKGFLNSLQWDDDENIDGIEKFFKLTTTKGLSLKNIHLYNNKNQIKKYNSVNEIFDEFYEERYLLYEKRKQYQLDNLRNELIILLSKKNFMNDVMNEKIIIFCLIG